MKVRILWKVTTPQKAGSPREIKHLECEAESGFNFAVKLFKQAFSETKKKTIINVPELFLTEDVEHLSFYSKKSILLEGVSKTHGLVKKGQRFKYLNYTFELLGIEEKVEQPEKVLQKKAISKAVKNKKPKKKKKVKQKSKPASKPQFRLSSIKGLLISAGLLALLVTVVSVVSGRYFGEHEQVPPVEQAIEEHSLTTLSEKPQPPQLAIYGPGDSLPDFKPDVLFIHAHPDDETLDFGCYLSWCEANDLSTAVLIFTDGESGLDYYPNRPVGGIYPDHEMEGEELADVRRQEAFNALTTLGADAYIRWGLKNHPYNGTLDQKGPDVILSTWQDESLSYGKISERLAKLISELQPIILVSADGPDKAREHFEHEAGGLLLRQSLDILKSQYPSNIGPELHLTVIDPRQADLYENKIMLSADLASADDAKTLREVQLEALLAHKTQRDSVKEGTTFLPEYPGEYYLVQSGDPDVLGWP